MRSLEKEIKHFFKGRENIDAVYLFGSHAKGLARRGSDVDVAVLFAERHVPDALSIINLKQDLSERVGADADIVILNTANPILKKQVIKHGKSILDNDHHHLSLFLIRLVTEYADLKRVRRTIEQNMLRGRIYG